MLIKIVVPVLILTTVTGKEYDRGAVGGSTTTSIHAFAIVLDELTASTIDNTPALGIAVIAGKYIYFRAIGGTIVIVIQAFA